MTIQKAMKADLPGVEALYEEVHDAEEAGTVTTGWLRGIYPVAATADAALERGDLFVMKDDEMICGAAIINNIQADAYRNAPWKYEADEKQVCVLHTLVISPGAGGRGLGKKFVAFYETYAAESQCYELRMDTNERNLRARTMYQKLGYQEIAVVPTVFNGIPGVNLVLLEKRLDL